jgi:hypothetical protein
MISGNLNVSVDRGDNQLQVFGININQQAYHFQHHVNPSNNCSMQEAFPGGGCRDHLPALRAKSCIMQAVWLDFGRPVLPYRVMSISEVEVEGDRWRA